MIGKTAEVALYALIWIVGALMILLMCKDAAHTISMIGTLIDIGIWTTIMSIVYWLFCGKSVFRL